MVNFQKDKIVYILEITLTVNEVSFANMSNDDISNYIFSYHTPEERAQFNSDMNDAISRGIIHSFVDEDYYTMNGLVPFKVNHDTNTVTINFLLYNPQEVCASVFDPPKVGMEPLRQRLENNPDMGSVVIRLLDPQERRDCFQDFNYTLKG